MPDPLSRNGSKETRTEDAGDDAFWDEPDRGREHRRHTERCGIGPVRQCGENRRRLVAPGAPVQIDLLEHDARRGAVAILSGWAAK